MARTTRQTAIFGVEDWKKIYQTYREADFQSYDFETLRKSFVDYIRLYYPEQFNDYIESSEFIALLDVMAFMGQSLAFRSDLNTRESYLDTAERRDSVVRLSNLVSYTPKRNTAAQGYLKVFSVVTTENVFDYNGVNLSNVTVDWNDPTNTDWQEQFTSIINAALVSNQRIGKPANSQSILGVDTNEYTINLVPGYLPVVPYNSTVNGVTMPFEAVSSTSVGKTFVYEPSPKPNGRFNFLYRNDQLGFGSGDTGYFFLFKQGVLQNQDFNLAERVSNRTVNINIEGVNNEDVWLYQIDNVGSIATEWEYAENVYAGAVEQLAPDLRKLFSVASRTNDQITMNFGDGVFSEIPVGLFRAYVRASNGLEYIINPEEMQSVTIPISYVSRVGRVETVTFTCGISSPVTNADARETIAEIKQRAPARYYTQNRMVNGEDYNNFPFTRYSSILKSKAIARSSVGTSRYLELVDNTGKYSSTNTFGSDGALWENDTVTSVFQFEWFSRNDISSMITNTLQPVISNPYMLQFYYSKFPRPQVSTLFWNQSTVSTNETSGYFTDVNGTPQPVGVFVTTNAQYIATGALIKFTAPAGQYFDADNRLQTGTPTKNNEKTSVWASPTAVIGTGDNQGVGNLDDGSGPVILNNNIPTGAAVTEIIPVFVTDLPTTIENQMIEQVVLYRNFGLGFNNETGVWYLITSTNLAVDAEFSLANAGNTTGTNVDASWLVQFVTDGESYTVTNRNLTYSFGSVLQTRFFFYSGDPIYDSRTGTVIKDFIKVLRTNSKPDSNNPLDTDIDLTIVGQEVQSDGYVNDYEVNVSFRDSDVDGVADNPDFFTDIVAPTTDANTKNVFFQKTVDFDNLERFLLVAANTINVSQPTYNAIELVKNEFPVGQVFYAYNQNTFWEITLNDIDQRILTQRTDYIAKVGRQQIYFQYRHNAPLSSRIDPGTTNIIDTYVVTQEYYNAYQKYITDTTNKVPMPEQPTINQLSIAYGGLDDYKMISDNMVLNSVTFKPLFGLKADPALRATIKVIKAQNSTASTTEIKSSVIAAINRYFTIDKWDFGDTFFFSELSAYLHERLGTIISSVVVVPLDTTKSFGDLYEIRCKPNEIFVNAATVTNVEVIDALTSTNIKTAPGSGVI